jgi:hypothetical protein
VIIIIGGLLLFFFILTLYAPDYTFPEPKPFSGNLVFNPYQDLDTSRWLKANFQVQSRVWWGITSGRYNNSKDVAEIYHRLGYDVICFSDYQHINKYKDNSSIYIPVYEHGFGIGKWHQVCINSRNVSWLDYPFWQSCSHKQNIINRLVEDNDIVAIAHPGLKNGYPASDFKYLSGYNLIEVFNHIKYSVAQWDSALSSGHPAFVLSDDDSHDISNPHLVGQNCTFIKSSAKSHSEVVVALKSGKAYGAEIYMAEEDGYPEKIAYSSDMPYLQFARIEGDTLIVQVSQNPKSIRFIGQNGVIKSTITGTSKASYLIRNDDTYIRAEILFPNKWGGDGTRFFLNPVFRYSGNNPVKMPDVSIDTAGTLMNRGIAIASLIVILFNIWFFLKKVYCRKKKGLS